ncbi:MAG: uncharacterized protein K0S89_855 [Nitrososphaeraceae archaeon]|nr:uncharacterized protein [Nitrososphaeraceae archaeon]
MTEDTSSAASSNAIPFPTLTILYLPSKASEIVEEISQKYCNMTAEDSLWFNAIIARIKELAEVNSVPIVSGGIMYAI